LETKIYRTINDVDERAWDEVAGKDRPLCSYKYVKLLEMSGVSKDRCYYVTVYEGGRMVAHACAYFIREELDAFARGPLKEMIGRARRKWKDFFILKSLECGPTMAPGKVLAFAEGVDRTKAMAKIREGMESLAKELGAKLILFRDFYDGESDLYGPLKDSGYKNIHNLPQAWMDVKWGGFNDYLGAMRSSYRCKITKSMDKCTASGISIGVLKGLSVQDVRELKRLYDNVYDNAKEVKRERLPAEFFENIEKYLGDDAVILAAIKNGRLVGYMFILLGANTLLTMFPGLDYEYNRDMFVYFNLFYRSIGLAIEKGIKGIDMGITTLNPKRDMGSGIRQLNMYMKHSNPLLNRILPVLFDLITPPDTTQPRDVFK
jgi:predicted N-acyltransferase